MLDSMPKERQERSEGKEVSWVDVVDRDRPDRLFDDFID